VVLPNRFEFNSNSTPKLYQVAEKRFGVLRRAQHERKMFNHFKPGTVRPEALEG
jgi:hypothetical protein